MTATLGIPPRRWCRAVNQSALRVSGYRFRATLGRRRGAYVSLVLLIGRRGMGATPLILGLGLTAGALTALGLTLVASVRRRRRSMAMLRALGFTGRQLAASACRP